MTFLEKIAASLFYMRMDINSRQIYGWQKNLSMGLKKLDWQNVKSGFKSIAIKNAKVIYSNIVLESFKSADEDRLKMI